jgi:hypothetical protein
MTERPGFNEDGTPIKIGKRKRAALIADKVIVKGVLGNTVGRVGKVAGRLLLGKVPETATTGSFQEEKPLEEEVATEPQPTIEEPAVASNDSSSPVAEIETTAPPAGFIDIVDEKDQSLLEGEIFDQVFANGKKSDSTEEKEWKVEKSVEKKELATAA